MKYFEKNAFFDDISSIKFDQVVNKIDNINLMVKK